MKHNLDCPCGVKIPVEIEEEIDLDNNPDTIEKICDGSFMNFICYGCGKKHKPEFKITILWKSKNLKIIVLPELERGEFYRDKNESNSIFKKHTHETIIGYPEMSDRIAVIKDNLEPVAIETLKYFLLAKAEENYPDNNINVWYFSKDSSCIEFHLDGIKANEVAVMKIPLDVYEKTCEDYRKHPKKDIFKHLRYGSCLSVQNIYRPDTVK